MEKTLTRAERWLSWAFLVTLIFFLTSVGIRWVTGKVMVFFNTENAFTKIVFFDNPQNMIGIRIPPFDWRTLYPFSSDSQAVSSVSKKPLLEKMLLKFSAKKRNVENWVMTDKLLGYAFFTGLAKRYEAFVNWNFASMSEYNGVVKLADGYLTTYSMRKDVSEAVQTTIDLANYCKDKGIDFLYVNAPAKICSFEDANISGVLDFVNQNADDFLQQISEAGVKYYDLRKVLHDEGMSHHRAFFRTDHHWLPETGLWASRHILQVLRDNYNWFVNPSVLNTDKFKAIKYPSWFLGSEGKKVTLERTTPDDFTLLYPTYPTLLRYQIPSLGIDVSGDFAVTYDMEQVKKRDYYNKAPYDAYNHSDKPVTEIENLYLKTQKSLLIIKDSFARAVIPFLAMGIKSIYALDIRHFNGSVRTYIESKRPDIVLVLYNVVAIGEPVKWDSHTSMFDFR